jgi:LysM repeat protein
MLIYTVKAGDTIASIARRQGISKEALLAANPQVNAAHLPPGKSINVPSR